MLRCFLTNGQDMILVKMTSASYILDGIEYLVYVKFPLMESILSINIACGKHNHHLYQLVNTSI